jgi:hypothetical protein
MRAHISAATKLNDIRMSWDRKAYKNKIFVLLEGKTDLKLFKKLFDTNKVQLEAVDGKDNVQNVVRPLLTDNSHRIVGICDADFDHLNEATPPPSIFWTDSHDSETMMIEGVGIDALIAEYANEHFSDGLNRQWLTLSLAMAYEIGLLKWLNSKNNLNLKFKNIDFNRFITLDGLKCEFDQTAFIDDVIHHSPSARPDQLSSFQAGIEQLRALNASQYQVCSGHDICQVMAMLVSQNDKPMLTLRSPVAQSAIESNLRVSYSAAHFAETTLYQQLSDWQTAQQQQMF